VLLPAADAHERLREIGFAMLLAERRPIGPVELAAASRRRRWGPSVSRPRRADRGGRSRRRSPSGTSSQRETGAAGQPSRAVAIDPYDALGIPAALGRDATVQTSCAACGRPIVVAMTAGRPDRRGPEQLWLAARGDDLRSQFCAPTVLLCGPDHGQTWAAAREHAGELLDLEEAALKGAADWGSCAMAARQIG